MENYDKDCVGNLNTSVVKELAKELPLYMAATSMSDIWLRIIIIGGLLGNILIVIIMMQRSNSWSSCSNYIAVLAASDSVALLRKSIDFLYDLFGIKYTHMSCAVWVYVALMACQFSMLLVMCMTVDRMIAVKFPNRFSIYCNVGRARRVMLILLIVALLFNIPHLFLTAPISDGKYCHSFAETHAWSFAYGWLQVIVNLIIPVISLTAMTIIIIRTLGHNRRKADEARKRRSSNAGQNFVVFITGDGLFHFVLAFIVNSFKDLEKQMSTSSINISHIKNQKATKVEQEGTINEAYADEQFNSTNADPVNNGLMSNDSKPSSKGESVVDADSLSEGDLVNSCRNLSQQNVDSPSNEANPENENDACQTQNNLNPLPNDPESPEKDESDTSVGDLQDEGSAQRRTPKEKPNQLNMMLFLVVFFFVLLTAAQHIRYLLYNHNFINRWMCPKAYATYIMIYHISNKAYFTNCAINFYLYFCGSSMFRKSIKEIFTCCCRRRKQGVEEEEQEEEEQQGVPTVSEQCDMQLANVICEGAHPPTTIIALAQPAQSEV